MKSEFELIELLKQKIPRFLQGEIPIGDDAAVLPGRGRERFLFTTDVLVEGVDFLWGKTPPEKIGRKALAVNLSDIAAMGGEPLACVISLGIPRHVNEKWIEKFYSGMVRLAKKYTTLCVGGDLSRSREFFVSVALLGRAASNEIITRKGACPGDWIGVTGMLGGSILGRHLEFEPRIQEGRWLARRFRPSAMIDISDGLLQDLGHLLEQSHTGAIIDLNGIPVSRAAKRLAKKSRAKALRHALTDGEDFELLFAISANKKQKLEKAWKIHFPQVPLSWIGCIRGRKPQILWMRGSRAVRAFRLRRKGFSHF
jgi:thiamine-monophosphate kinase